MDRATNLRLERIREALEESLLIEEAQSLQESAYSLIDLLEDAGIQFEGASVEDLVEAVESYIESDEFEELDEEIKKKIKDGFKMVFGKLVQLKDKGKALVKKHGKDVAKRALAGATALAIAAGAAGSHGGHGGHGGDHGGKATSSHSMSYKAGTGDSGGHGSHDPEPEHQHFSTKNRAREKNLKTLYIGKKK